MGGNHWLAGGWYRSKYSLKSFINVFLLLGWVFLMVEFVLFRWVSSADSGGIQIRRIPQIRRVHPGRLTWTIIMEVWKIIFLSFHGWLVGSMLIFQGVKIPTPGDVDESKGFQISSSLGEYIHHPNSSDPPISRDFHTHQSSPMKISLRKKNKRPLRSFWQHVKWHTTALIFFNKTASELVQWFYQT